MTFGGRRPDLAILVEDEVVVVEVLHRESSLRRSLLRISCHLRIDTDQPLRTSGLAVRGGGGRIRCPSGGIGYENEARAGRPESLRFPRVADLRPRRGRVLPGARRFRGRDPPACRDRHRFAALGSGLAPPPPRGPPASAPPRLRRVPASPR